MLINGIDISTLGIELYDRTLSSNEVNTSSEWLDGDIQPTFIRQQDKFKTLSLTFLVLGKDEEEAFKKMSKLTQLLRKSEIKFDDMDLLFKATMTGSATPKRLSNGNFTITYTMKSDYALGAREVYTTNANATNSFKLNLLYYQDSTTLISSESVTIRAASFNETTVSLTALGVNLNKYLPEYYSDGVVTNLGNTELTYDGLKDIGTLIINYTPTRYNLEVQYYVTETGEFYDNLMNEVITFTKPQLSSIINISNLITGIKSNKPDGYSAKTNYTGLFTVEDLLKASPISVFYDKIEGEISKNVLIDYQVETDNGYETIHTSLINVKTGDFVGGEILTDFLKPDAYRPSALYYTVGLIDGHNLTESVDYNTFETTYTIKYNKAVNTIYVEYYYGVYPGWYRVTSNSLQIKHKDSYIDNFDFSALGVDVDKYKTNTYKSGKIYNQASYDSYETVLNTGIVQVYYEPIDYTITVNYYKTGSNEIIGTDTVTINELDFLGEVALSDIINVGKFKEEGYQFDINNSYKGELTLSKLLLASPIEVKYEEVEAERTKNIIIRYRQELSSTYGTLNTSIVTINESDCVGGVRLRDIISLNAYRPDYYESGIIDGFSESSLQSYDNLESSYNVLYMASQYVLPVRYYRNLVADENWIGSSTISYRVIDFSTTSTLFDFGLSLNALKPDGAEDGVLQYNGPINFSSLRELESLDIVYTIGADSGGEGSFEYPHRFLYLQHNDLKDYEYLHPNWTMNHAYINTGVAVNDMSKLTVIMECDRVDPDVPLYQTNSGYSYLFGSASSMGYYYMRFNNQTQYGVDLTGVNTYEAMAGRYTNLYTQAEDSAIGFSANSGIYASERDGHSLVTFTYTGTMESDNGSMPYPLYLFALNQSGQYYGGISGIGIYSCRIYYDGELIRDYIPVAFYDKIGDQVAPSNCLYDKVTKTFYEDATGQNSFNIRDDERYIDNNPDHKIGKCYIRYYKGEEMFQNSILYFRESDFLNGDWNPYEKLMVDELQPSYYNTGNITNLSVLGDISFDKVNNFVFNVVYELTENHITVNYYAGDEDNLIATERIPLAESDFYQVPTFGDIVRINKHKPEGYETNFEYTGTRVSLARVLAGSPYNIIYTKADRELKTYTTEVKYIKKIWGLRTYQTVGTETITLDETQFRDGEYIDYHIDLNKYKPDKYYLDGETYEWYEMDERLTTPEMLKPQYIIAYQPATIALEVRYYRDEVVEGEEIATSTWNIKVDDFDETEPFNLVDQLDNTFINKYKPVGCQGGNLVNPEVWYTFSSLIEDYGHIDIVYKSLEEPHDPTNASYEQKVIYWGNPQCIEQKPYSPDGDTTWDATIPWIDLGYTPKEIGRLRVELKGVGECYTIGIVSEKDSGAQYFGYYGGWGADRIATSSGNYMSECNAGNEAKQATMSSNSLGMFSIGTRVPTTGGFVYTAEGPQSVDGQTYYTAASATGVIAGSPKALYQGVNLNMRRGKQYDWDDEYNVFTNAENRRLSISEKVPAEARNLWTFASSPTEVYSGEDTPSAIANPYSVIMDAYNGYMSISSIEMEHNPFSSIEDYSNESNLFENREKPKGTLTLFKTRNPYTGKMNISPFGRTTLPTSGYIRMALGSLGDIYDENRKLGEYTTETTVYIPTTDADGTTTINVTKQQNTVNIQFANYNMAGEASMNSCMIWGVKIYDRDKLVRDLIPVAKGDQIYDYTMPENGLFDLVTEIFFGNSNHGGTYSGYSWKVTGGTSGKYVGKMYQEYTMTPEQVQPLKVVKDPLTYGKITNNYYDWDNSYIDSEFVDIPTWYNTKVNNIENILQWNDFKPDEFHLDGMIDLDKDLEPSISNNNIVKNMTMKEIYELGSANIFYKQKTFTKTIVFYNENTRIGSRDLFFSLEEITKAKSISEIMEKAGVSPTEFLTDDYGAYQFIFNDKLLEDNDIEGFINAPSPIVRYLPKENGTDGINRLYVSWYRGGASDDDIVSQDPDNENYLLCDMEAAVLNPKGAIKYITHYHSALYEDEEYDYFIPYQVKIINKYTGIHYGPAAKYKTLAMIITNEAYTIVEERNGWGRLKEYRHGWIRLSSTEKMTGPGQNPDYDVPTEEQAVIPFATKIKITKLTNDRLWAYAPDYDSWIKTEEISFDQYGKYLMALGSKVIHIDDIDFDTARKASDLGYDVNAYRLRFHDAGVSSPDISVYLGTNMLKSFMIQKGKMEIVYPETVYNYVGRYYKDFKDDKNLLGSIGFSTTVGDFNIDWDYFIETSFGKDEEGNDLSPTLYRGNKDLVLTWDYFGLEQNLYKPSESYDDGLYTWNPYGWDRNNQYFTFRQLIATGAQNIIYLPKMTDYKMMVYSGALENNYDTMRSYTGSPYKDSDRKGFDYATYPVPYSISDILSVGSNGLYDAQHIGVRIEKEPYRLEKKIIDFSDVTASSKLITGDYVYNKNNFTSSSSIGRGGYENGNNSRNQHYLFWDGDSYSSYAIDLGEPDIGESLISYINTYDNNQYVVGGLNNKRLGKNAEYFVIEIPEKYRGHSTSSQTLLKDSKKMLDSLPYELDNTWADAGEELTVPDFKYLSFKPRSIVHGIQIYNKNIIEADLIPVPANSIQTFNGKSTRIPYNTYWDRLSGKYLLNDENIDTTNAIRWTSIFPAEKSIDHNSYNSRINLFSNWNYGSTTTAGYFVKMKYEYNNIGGYSVTYPTGYKYPSINSEVIRRALANEIMYCSKTISTNKNGVEGSWYYCQGAWYLDYDGKSIIPYSGTEVVQSRFSLYNSSAYVVKVSGNVKSQASWPNAGDDVQITGRGSETSSGTKIYRYPSDPRRRPDTLPAYGEGVSVWIYGTYTDNNGIVWYLTNYGWVDKRYTSKNIEEVNKNYVVATETVPYYNRPCEKDAYKVNNYLYGERLTIISHLIGTNWYYTGKNWINTIKNLTEV